MNPILEAIQDEITRALESDIDLPPEFVIYLPQDQFSLMLKHGLYLENGKPVSDEVMAVWFEYAGYRVSVKTEENQGDKYELV